MTDQQITKTNNSTATTVADSIANGKNIPVLVAVGGALFLAILVFTEYALSKGYTPMVSFKGGFSLSFQQLKTPQLEYALN